MTDNHPNQAISALAQPGGPDRDTVVMIESPTDTDESHVVPESPSNPAEFDGENADLIQMLQDDTLIQDALSPRQIGALPYLIGPGSASQRARNAGISRTTLYRWLEEPDFRDTLQRLRKEVLHVAEISAQSMAQDAISVIFELMQSGRQRVRLDAALAALKLAQSARQTEHLDRRVDNLERAAALRKKSQWPGF